MTAPPPANRPSLKERLSLPRAEGVSDLQAALAFGGRFADELLSGLPNTLMPTIQQSLGMSLTQVSLLRQVLDGVAVVVEPVNGLLLDVWPRRRIMAWGAAGTGLVLILIGAAPGYGMLLLAYALWGMVSGPLAHTGDVVVVESYPTVPDRAFTRSNLFDTVGALLGPLIVSLTLFAGLPWQLPLYVLGAGGFVYALVILRAGLPRPPLSDHVGWRGLLQTLQGNIRVVVADRGARRWLALLFAFNVLETPFILKTIWLAQEAGMSQELIGVYQALELVIAFVSLMVLEWWRQRTSARRVLLTVIAAVFVLYPLWLFIPGVWSKFLLMPPLGLFFFMFWPLLRGSSLASVPGKAGVVTAVTALFGLAPLPLLFGLLADAIGLTPAMFGVHLLALPVLALLALQTQ